MVLVQQVGRKKETAQVPVSGSKYLSADQLQYSSAARTPANTELIMCLEQ